MFNNNFGFLEFLENFGIEIRLLDFNKISEGFAQEK